ncbi:MAG: hypothetical protein MR455_06825 [Prevotella sp.]|nr:hypothetical protein [Prevotella sp.]
MIQERMMMGKDVTTIYHMVFRSQEIAPMMDIHANLGTLIMSWSLFTSFPLQR